MPKQVFNQLGKAKQVAAFGPGRHADGNCLYLVVNDAGARWWEWRGTVRGQKSRVIRGMGSAREKGGVTLAEARATAAHWCRLARQGIDPKEERDKHIRQSLTFEAAARKVWAEQVEPHASNAKHRAQWINTLATYAFPKIGARPVHAIDQSDILKVLAPVWTEKPETARRVRQRLRTVFDWARTAGHFEGVNPVEGVEKGLPKQRDTVRHHSALPWEQIPDLMKRLTDVDGIGGLALRFAILTAARSGEVRGATWPEIDLDAALWLVPAERMKGRREHRVPLSQPALDVLAELRGLSGDLVFPSARPRRPISNMTISAVLRRLGSDATPHGMRSTFRDWCEEQTIFPHEVKEAALAHTVRNKVEAAYRRTDLFEKRRDLMDQWGRFCLSAGRAGDVVEIRR